MNSWVWKLFFILIIVLVIISIVLLVTTTATRCTLPPPKNTNRQSPIEIDLVITWVDGNDKERNALRATLLKEHEKDHGIVNGESKSAIRYIDHDELKYVLKSVDRFAPWIHKIWILCSGDQRPSWLRADHPIIKVISDTEIMEPASLPTFNSHAFECNLHKIPGLSEYFLYGNDDMFFGNITNPDLFFDSNTQRMKLFTTPLFPLPVFLNGMTYGKCDHKNAWINNTKLLDTIKTESLRPYPNHNITILSKTMMADAEKTFAEDWQRTSKGKFRSRTDIHPVGLSQFLSVYRDKADWQAHVFGCANITASTMLNEAYFNLLSLLRPQLHCLNNIPPNISEATMQSYLNFMESYYHLATEPKPDWLV